MEGKISAPEMCSKSEQKRLADEDEEIPLEGPIPKRLLVEDFFDPYRERGPSCILSETEFDEVALQLSEDVDFLDDAQMFLESLQSDEPRVNNNPWIQIDEPRVNINAWKRLCEGFRRNWHDHNLARDMACWFAEMINADPSLKSASGETKPVAIMRFVLSILTVCWHSISVPAWAAANDVSDPANFFAHLFHDASVKDVAQQLARDIDLVREASKFMEPLRGDRPVVNIDAWTDLSHRLDSALDKCSLELSLPRFELKEIYKYRTQTVVQARKLIAVGVLCCINSDPSLKPLLGERDEVHLIRVVITLLITFWRDEEMAVFLEFMPEPMSIKEEDKISVLEALAGEVPTPKGLRTLKFLRHGRHLYPACFFNETEFNKVALQLAEEEDFLQHARKFLGSLGGEVREGNIEAWIELSERIFRAGADEHKLFTQSLFMETALWTAQIMNADPSLKSSFLGESEPGAITRLVVSTLLVSWYSICVPGCAFAVVDQVPDTATFFTRLVHDPSVKDVAQQLAGDIDFVREASKFMEPLRGDKPIVNVDAWTNLSHLLDSALKKCSLLPSIPRVFLKVAYKNRAQTVVQARKLIAVSTINCIIADPSLKSMLGERDEVDLIRVVIALLITFWRDKFVAKPFAVFLTKQVTSDEEDKISADESTRLLSSSPEHKRGASPDALDGEEECTLDKDEPSLIVALVDAYSIEVCAEFASKEAEVVEILKEFLETLSNNSQHDALQHFDKVKKVFENHLFIRILLNVGCCIYMRDPFLCYAGRDLAEFLNRKMRGDPSFGDIFKHKEPANMLRSALSILVGYWSNRNSLSLLVCSTGNSAFGDDVDVLLKEEDALFATCARRAPICSSIIAGLCRDASIEELAEQLSRIPQAVELAEKFLDSILDEAPERNQLDRNYYHDRQFDAACRFWHDPIIVVELIKAFKKSTRLLDVLKEYSKGAQLLRCEERMARIKRDPELQTILEGDQALQIRGALSILIGYWNAKDVVEEVSSLYFVKSATPKLDLSEGSVEIFDYLTDYRGDVEGLKNVLGDKHPRDSTAFLDRFDEIKGYQKRKELMVEPEYRGFITVVLKNGHVIHFQMVPLPCHDDLIDKGEKTPLPCGLPS